MVLETSEIIAGGFAFAGFVWGLVTYVGKRFDGKIEALEDTVARQDEKIKALTDRVDRQDDAFDKLSDKMDSLKNDILNALAMFTKK
ncbi:hypothetical protein HLBENOHH_02067 [Aeromonas dhakensis]|uniref:hypothetical protein n=1 Tax=Aeromonas dhakensis TaxID=196024 RepID=UPI00367157C2